MTIQERARASIAHGALTNSKRPTCFVRGVYPTHASRGFGVYLSAEGRIYVDWIRALGTSLMGYANATMASVVEHEYVVRGGLYSLSSVEEVEFAESFKCHFPFVDCIRVLKSGSEGCSAAVRIARAYKGVSNATESMHEMYMRKAVYGIFKEHRQKGWPGELVQDLCAGIPKPTKGNGDKKIGPGQVFQDGEGEGGGKKTLPQKKEEGRGPGEKCGVLRGSEECEKKAMRGVWEHEIASPPRRLFEAARREVALQYAPFRITSRSLVLSDGYHGHSDAFTSLTPPHNGVPFDLNVLPLSGNEDLFHAAACVIVEPVITDHSESRRAWLRDIRKKCDDTRTVLIFDETITGLRFPGLSVAAWSGVTPDLIVTGKALANGLPISVVGGKREIMEADYFISSTFAGDTIPMAAAQVVMPWAKANIDRLWREGGEFVDGFRKAGAGLVWIEGYPTRGILRARDELTKALFMQEMCLRGHLFGSSWFWCDGHEKVAESTLKTVAEVCEEIAGGRVQLKGEMPQQPFAQKVRDGKA